MHKIAQKVTSVALAASMLLSMFAVTIGIFAIPEIGYVEGCDCATDEVCPTK